MGHHHLCFIPSNIICSKSPGCAWRWRTAVASDEAASEALAPCLARLPGWHPSRHPQVPPSLNSQRWFDGEYNIWYIVVHVYMFNMHFTRVYGTYMVHGVINQHIPTYNIEKQHRLVWVCLKITGKLQKCNFQCRIRGSIRKIRSNLFSNKPRRNQLSICTPVRTNYIFLGRCVTPQGNTT